MTRTLYTSLLLSLVVGQNDLSWTAFAVLEGDCGLDETGTCVRSPNFPKAYGSSSCTIGVQAGVLHATHFDTEPAKDILSVGSMSEIVEDISDYSVHSSYDDSYGTSNSPSSFSGTAGPLIMEVTGTDSLSWIPRSDVKHYGWEVCWSSSPSSATTTTTESALCPDILDFVYNRDGSYTGDTFQVVSGACTVKSSGYCVRSPNYPQQYNDNDCCTIEAPAGNLSFTSFEVEESHDRLFVAYYDVFVKFFSEPPMLLLEEGGRIAWTSDARVHHKGWELCADHEPVPVDEIIMLVGGCIVSGNCVSSQHFPSFYEANERCEFQVPAGSIYATTFGTEMHFDHLFIGDTAYHGTWGPWGHEVASGAEVAWEADASVQSGGWRVCVLSEDMPETTTAPMVGSVTVLSGECTMTTSSCVASVGYPEDYSHDGSCEIAMPAGFISATSFDTERFYDYLYVAGAHFDGVDGPQFVKVSDGGRVVWASDASVSRKGWEICHDQTAPSLLTLISGSCVVSGDCVKSPHYPSNYDDDPCTIYSPPGWISRVAFETELQHDLLYLAGEVYHGNFGEEGTELSGGGLIVWKPDFQVMSKGWELCLEARQPEVADSLTSFFGDCVVSGNCASSPSLSSARCSLGSPAGWISYTQEEGDYDYLYVAGDVYDGAVGRWGVELPVGGVIHFVPHADVQSGWEVCWTETRPSLPSVLTVFSGDCLVSGGCVAPNSHYDNFTTCAFVSPPGWVSYSHFRESHPLDDLFVDGVVYDGAVGPWGIELPGGGVSLWTLGPGAEEREVCWTETRPDVPAVLTVFSGACEVSGDCVNSPNYPSTYDSASLCIMWSPPGALFAQDFDTEARYDGLLVDSVWYDGVYGPWNVDLPSGGPLFWFADSISGQRGWQVCLADLISSSTITTTGAYRVVGYVRLSVDASGQAALCSSIDTAAKQAVAEGTDAVSMYNVTVNQVTSVVASPCPSRRLSSQGVFHDVHVSIEFEMSFETGGLANVVGSELSAHSLMFNDVFQTYIETTLNISVSNVQVEVTEVTKGLLVGASGSSRAFFGGAAVILSIFG